MIDLTGMVSIPYLKKSPFTGSEKEMRFLIRRQDGGEGEVLQAAVWPGPFSFAATEEDKKTYCEFPFEKDGLDKAVEWLNRYYRENYQNESDRGASNRDKSDRAESDQA